MKVTKKNLQKLLKNTDEFTLKHYVLEYAIRVSDDYNDPKTWFTDLLTHGCISGMIGSLISYNQTKGFYDFYYDEIEDLRQQYEDDFGAPLKIRGDLKNFLAWFAFEETARKIYENDFEMEL
jgi:hypothetical protein